MSIAVLRRSRRVQRRVRRAVAPRHHRAVPRPEPRDRRRARRPRRPRQVADRLGQDARLRHPDRSSGSHADGPRPAALVLAPTRELASQIVDELRDDRARPRAARSPPSTAASASPSRPRRGARRTSSSRRRAASRICSPAGAFSLDADPACSCSTRPTACSTWASGPRSTGSCALPARRARRCSSRPRSTAWPARSRAAYTTRRGRPRARPAGRRAPRARSSTASSPVAGDDRVEALVERAAPASATSRSSSCAPSAAPTASSSGSAAHGVAAAAIHGNKSQSQREQALARFESGRRRHARRHRRRRPRHRRRGHLARDQLRPARGPRHLRAPRRAHRPRRAPGCGDHASSRPSSTAIWPSWPTSSGSSTNCTAGVTTRRHRAAAGTRVGAPVGASARSASQQRRRRRQRAPR